jgi:hypothetical protein
MKPKMRFTGSPLKNWLVKTGWLILAIGDTILIRVLPALAWDFLLGPMLLAGPPFAHTT